ncbi:hypothetical protein POM88_004716 [Heracleum sosnowskyi]|uniref:Replication factor A C-terminal domain-containing protein n=1 Tax=Heracleum sosnowskyi TaxID=360622 RepID=A0AAD8JK35_9APIA|nr:hypothetical protein POM88_004716 [Heracleum sosnowskyi]
MYDPLIKLDKSKTLWRIKVRVMRTWPTRNSEKNKISGFNLILCDEDESLIHAFVYADKWEEVGEKIKEGSINVFEDFTVNDAYDLSQYVNETPKGQKEVLPDFAIDIIGAVEEPELVTKVTTSIGLRDKFIFKVTDGRKSHRVTVWGDDETIYIGLLSSSKAYLNLEDDVVLAMRSRLEEIGYKGNELKCQSLKDDEIILIEMLTIKSMMELTDKAYIKKQVFCRIKVNQIEDQDCWWYNSCNTCKYEVSILDGAFKCTNCTKLIPVPQKRYRLCIIAEDETDACNVILQDMAVKRIVGVTATKLKAEMDKDKPESKDLPDKIKNIVGKEYTSVIDIHKDNILSDSNIYYADDICDFKSTNEVSNSNFSKAEQYSLSTSSTALEINTPGTAKSSRRLYIHNHLSFLIIIFDHPRLKEG